MWILSETMRLGESVRGSVYNGEMMPSWALISYLHCTSFLSADSKKSDTLKIFLCIKHQPVVHHKHKNTNISDFKVSLLPTQVPHICAHESIYSFLSHVLRPLIPGLLTESIKAWFLFWSLCSDNVCSLFWFTRIPKLKIQNWHPHSKKKMVRFLICCTE